ncbi:hypothetical protein SAMN04489719_2223 [Agrococcus carbonis]|uniref:Uncharacterized protein n=1 Tax=Agrococcus carbonis TaxID=684552 RepID=A0A1H1RV62_9MICO|nr:hypothetical protein SAMN04489719_2223 [Agrococcus carbonis]
MAGQGPWSKSRILFLALGVVLVGVGLWLILPTLLG